MVVVASLLLWLVVVVAVAVEGLSWGRFQEEEGVAAPEPEFEHCPGSWVGAGVEEGVS